MAHRGDRATGWTALAGAVLLLLPAGAWAEQFVMADVTYEHSTTTTTDSHYYVNRPANAPGNWKSPIDYTAGTAYTHIEVFTKPAGNAPSVWVICFEGSPGYACYWSPVYRTAPTTLDFTFPVKDFVLLGNGIIDWTRPIPRTALILKDDKNVKPAPENVGAERAALYLPTRVRIVVTIVSPGGTYVPPPASRPDGGMVDASNDSGPAADAAPDAPVRDAAIEDPSRPDAPDAGGPRGTGGAPGVGGTSGVGGVGASGTGGMSGTAGGPSGSTGGATPLGPPSPAAPTAATSGCSATPGRSNKAPASLFVLALVAAALVRARAKLRA